MTTPHALLASLALLAGLLLNPATAHAAESYDNCTGFIDSVPMTVSTQGVWCLRQNVSTSVTSGAAVTVAGNNITIDCNDFKIGGLAAGDGSQTTGIYAFGRQNTTVRHCNVRGFFNGILLSDGAGNLVEDNRLDNNLFNGIYVTGDHNLVQRNQVYDTGGASGGYTIATGIYASGDVIDNTVDGAFASATDSTPRGIVLLGNGSEARGNRIRGLTPSGSGAIYGIIAFDAGEILDGNRVVAASATPGIGISGLNGANTACIDNVVVNFATKYQDCAATSGDIGLP